MSDAEDRWYVNVNASDVRMMTLDELVEAFEAGIITQETLVVEVGGNEWQPLKEVADLGEDEPVPAAAPRAQAAPQSSWPPPAVARAESAWPPASAWDSVAPAAATRSRSSAPLSGIPNSTVPVVQDLDLDFGPQSFKPSGRKNVAVFAVLAVALAAGAGFALTRGGAMSSAVPVPVPAAAPVAASPTPFGAPKQEATSPVEAAKASDDRLSDEQKKALLSADKDRDEKKRSRPVAAPRSGGGAPKSGAVFRANGNANDPLNPTL